MAVEIPTVDQMQQRAIAEVQTRNPRLTDVNEGSTIDAVTGAGAVLADESIRVTLNGQRRFFFSTAIDGELDALAADRNFPPRKDATGGVGTFTWTKGDPSASYVLPAGHRVQGTLDDGTPVVVESTAAVVVGAADLFVEVPGLAQDTGPQTNLAPGFLDAPVDIIPADPAATVTNAARFVGGDLVESNEAYRARLELFFSTLRRGTVAALTFGALSVGGVSIATVDESLVSVDGIVRVYIGDPDARSNALLAAAVAVALEAWRSAGVRVLVLGADREEIPVALQLTIPAGSNRSALAEDIRANILAYTDFLSSSETLRVSELCFRAHDASPLVLSVVSIAPAADVSPTQVQDAIRVNEADISLTWVEV